jgi:hypothetical protein
MHESTDESKYPHIFRRTLISVMSYEVGKSYAISGLRLRMY